MVRILSFFVQWFLVPGIIVCIFFLSLIITSVVEQISVKISAKAGIWAGILLFIIFVINFMESTCLPELGLETLPGLRVTPSVISLGGGFIFLWFLRILVSTRLVGVITLIITTVSLIALFAYIFLTEYHILILYTSFGTALGILIHIVLFPNSIKIFFENKDQKKKNVKYLKEI